MLEMLKKILVFSALIVMFAACLEEEEEYRYQKTGQDFDNKGGTYKGVDGITVILDEGSLPEGIDVVTISAYSLNTPVFTNVSKPVTNIYSISPAAVKFAKNLTVAIYYKETDFPNLLDEQDLKPYFSMDRQTFIEIDEDSYKLDVESNLFKISTPFLGNFHIGFPKDKVKQEDADQAGIAEMVLIPAGEFKYGAPEGTPTGLSEEEDGLKKSEGTNTVYLSSYYIDKYEVSNSQYKLCQDAGVCTEPYDVTSIMYQNYYNNPTYAGFPVIWVSYNQALTFCQWAGKKLPTEAQWEKAAKGKTMGKYPWGDKEPADNIDAARVNYLALFGDVTDVMWNGNVEGEPGKSDYGVYNMSGNVAEWTDTWHNIDSYYHKRTDDVVVEDPIGPSDSPTQEKVIRGGSWVSLKDEITTYARDKAFPSYRYYNLGFRCVQPVSQ